MKIQQVQQNSFTAKPRYITEKISYDLENLLRKMNADTFKTESGDFWHTHEVKSLTIPNQGSIKRGKFLAKRNEFDELIPYGEHTTMLELGKSRIIVNNRTRRIIEHKKPFFMSWKSLLHKASDLIIEALNNYHNCDRVKKVVIQKEGLTKSGAEKAEREMKPIFDFIEKMGQQWQK